MDFEKHYAQGDLFDVRRSYRDILKDKNAAIKKYKEHSFAKDLKDGLEQDVRLLQLREHVQRVNRDSEKALNLLLLDEFKDRLKIKFEQTSPPSIPLS